MVPFASVADAVDSATTLIACSHVSWVGGEVADVDALVATGVPVLLDAAQALGAVAFDVVGSGVDFYAGSGQKWLCGPEGSGALYVRRDALDQLEPPWPSYSTLSDHDDILGSTLSEAPPGSTSASRRRSATPGPCGALGVRAVRLGLGSCPRCRSCRRLRFAARRPWPRGAPPRPLDARLVSRSYR